MSDIPALLQPLKDRLAAATPGPWRTWVDDTGRRGAAVETAWAHDEEGADTELITDWCSTEDATLIAHAPTDQAKLIAAIEAVVGLHKEVEGYIFGAIPGAPADYRVCSTCFTEDERPAPYPCPTVAALTQALGDG